MERKDDHGRGPLARQEVAGTVASASFSSSPSSSSSSFVGSGTDSSREQKDTERFTKYQKEIEIERQQRQKEMEKRDREAQNSTNGEISDEQLRGMVRHKLKLLEAADTSMIDDESGSLLPTSHHILFKISDYFSMPKHMNCSTIRNQIIGRRLKDKDGYYVKQDDGRFLFLFHDFKSFCLIGIAFLILFAQYRLLKNLYDRSGNHQCDESLYFNTESPSWEVVLLCVVYAAGAATEDFFVLVPYEIIGKDLESYCIYVHEQVKNRKRVKRQFWIQAIVNFLYRPSKSGSTEGSTANSSDSNSDSDIHIASRFRVFVDLVVAIIVSFANLIMVVLTVLVMGYQIAYSSGTVDMIQNFIAVEIILHINEIIPKMFWIKDLSPYRFKKSLFETFHELEVTKAIPTYYKDSQGAETNRIHWSYTQWRTFVFTFFTFIMCLVLLIVSVSYEENCGDQNLGDD